MTLLSKINEALKPVNQWPKTSVDIAVCRDAPNQDHQYNLIIIQL